MVVRYRVFKKSVPIIVILKVFYILKNTQHLGIYEILKKIPLCALSPKLVEHLGKSKYIILTNM